MAYLIPFASQGLMTLAWYDALSARKYPIFFPFGSCLSHLFINSRFSEAGGTLP